MSNPRRLPSQTRMDLVDLGSASRLTRIGCCGRQSERTWFMTLVAGTLLLASTVVSTAQQPPLQLDKPIREIYVPFEDLNVLLESPTRHVFMTRKQYQELMRQAAVSPEKRAPVGASILSADYRAVVELGRARVVGQLELEVLADGVQTVPLDLSGVGVLRAVLDGQPAALAKDESGRPVLVVEGRGRRRLILEMVLPLTSDVDRQSLKFQLPNPSSTHFSLTVPGDVEIKEGAEVIRRHFDPQVGVTELELLPVSGPTLLSLSLSNRRLRERSAVVARSVLVDEITEAYERLHATVSLGLLHGASGEFRFVVPSGFEVTSVETPLLARYVVEERGPRRILRITLREPSRETVVINISAVKTPSRLTAWEFPRLLPLDTVGQVAVVGLLLENRLAMRSLQHESLLPLDNDVLTAAIPESVFAVDPGAPQVRSVATYYSPQADYQLRASFAKPPVALRVQSDVSLVLTEPSQTIEGRFRLFPQREKLFELRFAVPEGWHVTSVASSTGPRNSGEQAPPTSFDVIETEAGARVRVRLPQGILPGEQAEVRFQAVSTPPDWLGNWQQQRTGFPVFTVEHATSQSGIIAIDAQDDLLVRPELLEGLIPVDEGEKERYRLQHTPTDLVYRFDDGPYRADLLLERIAPKISARTYSFVKVQPAGIHAHYEIIYDIRQARTRRLSLRLPQSTPQSISIRGMEQVVVKELESREQDGDRIWTALLARAHTGSVRLVVDLQDRLPDSEPQGFVLPLVAAEGVQYQTAIVAVEGHNDLDIAVAAGAARKVDIGELAGADYVVGRRLLGAFAFLGRPGVVQVDVRRRPGYRLPAAIVERAELVTVVSASGLSQTGARYQLRTKSPFLEIRLPTGAKLWSILLGGESTKPQREGDSLLIGLSGYDRAEFSDLQIVYETPSVARIGGYGQLATRPPQLFLRDDSGETGRAVPVADLVWHLELPTGYRVVDEDGTVFSGQFDTRPMAITRWLRGFSDLLSSARPLSRIATSIEDGMDVQAMAQTDGAQMELEVLDSAPAASRSMRRRDAVAENAPAEKADMSGMGGGMASGAGMAGAGGAAGNDEGPGGMGGGGGGFPAAEEGREFQSPDADSAPVSPAQDPFGEVKEESVPQTADETNPVDTLSLLTEQTQSLEPSADRSVAPGYWALQGVGSLPIDIQQQQQRNRLTFRSLGERPRLMATLVDGARLQALDWTAGLVVGWIGLLLMRKSRLIRIRFILLVLFVSTALPLVTGWIYQLGPACDLAFLAGCLLIPFYLLIAASRSLARLPYRTWRRLRGATALLGVAVVSGSALAQDPAPIDLNRLAPLWEDRRPVELPADAVIIPYQAQGGLSGIATAEKILVPYDRYVALWNRAYPDRPIDLGSHNPEYGLAGAHYTIRLLDAEDLLVEGQLEFELFTERGVSIPLPLAGGVLTKAELDGVPARLLLAAPTARPAAQVRQQAQQQVEQRAVPSQVLTLQAVGKGRKRLKFAIRLRLEQRGGWRIATGWLPTAPANRLRMTVPRPRTEVRLRGVQDRSLVTTSQPNQTIETTLKAGVPFSLQWRPQVAQTVVDESLTAQSAAVLDVQEDGLLMTWKTNLEFRRSRRTAFSLRVPKMYVVEQVRGANVGHWEMREDQDQRVVDVSLLKEVAGQTSLTMVLSRRGEIGGSDLSEFAVPLVEVDGAALHTGVLQIRRSPLLQMRVIGQEGVSRTESSQSVVESVVRESGDEESPLGIRPFQSYRFATTPYRLRLGVTPLTVRATAQWQAVLRIGERRVDLESKVLFSVRGRPLSAARLRLPSSLNVTHVEAPGEFEWAITGEGPERQLAVYLATHQRGAFALIVKGTLNREGPVADVALPRLRVLDVERQGGAFAIQVDPAYNATVAELVNCSSVLKQQIHRWLSPAQRRVTERVVRFRDDDYSGVVHVTPERPDVKVFTISNIRVTERTIEETILLDYQVQRAGIRELSFLLPERFEAAEVRVPLLRQKQIAEVAERPGQVRFQLELQDDVMGQIQVLIKHDRLLNDDVQTAPIPIVETGQAATRFVVLESAGRDEVVVEESAGLDPLNRQQIKRALLSELMQEGTQQTFAVRGDTNDPRLQFRNRPRTAVQTAGALIGKAETRMVIDGSGAYRARVTYQVNNDTEQYLEVVLPLDSDLWTVTVAGDSVKPTQVSSSDGPQHVRVPLVKTAEGDRDYPVTLKYGGRLFLSRHMTSASFPFVHTVNINVEQSQVHLRLPRSHRWFRFGGNMQRIRSEGDYRAEDLVHLTRQMQRVTEALSSKNPYSKIRAMNSFRDLKAQQNEYEQSYQHRYGKSADLAKQLNINRGTAQQAERQLEEVRDESQQDAAFSNSFRLEQVWRDQRNDRSRNIVTELTDNFDARSLDARSLEETGEAKKTPQSVGGFNRKWFKQNKLQNESSLGEKASAGRLKSATELRRSKKNDVTVVDGLVKGTPGDSRDGQQPASASKAATGKPAPALKSAAPPSTVPRKNQELERYRRQLALDGGVSSRSPAKGREAQHGRRSSSDGLGNGADVPGFSNAAGERFNGYNAPPGAAGPDATSEPAQPTSGGQNQQVAAGSIVQEVATGDAFLTSLDVDLPLDARGDDYFFSTPRGRIEITATAVSTSFFDRALKFGSLLAVFVAAWVAIKVLGGLLTLLRGADSGRSPA